jgi:futalosine hydrolase
LKFLLTSATRLEIAPLLSHLEKNWQKRSADRFHSGMTEIKVLITGVGLTATAFALGRELTLEKYDLAIQAGVGGAVDKNLPLGAVVRMDSEQFADLGAEDAAGGFLTLFDLGLAGADDPPFRDERLLNPGQHPAFKHLPAARGISVNRVHGHEPAIDRLIRRFPDAQVESMEGAAFFYACLQTGTPFEQLRAISNYVEPRNRASWQLREAIARLNGVLLAWIRTFG